MRSKATVHYKCVKKQKKREEREAEEREQIEFKHFWKLRSDELHIAEH